jgi:hypothetical protein
MYTKVNYIIKLCFCINVLFSGINGICLCLGYEKLQSFEFVHESTPTLCITDKKIRKEI